MSTFYVTIEVGDLEGLRFEPVEALADTGASYTRAPRSTLLGLGIRPERRWPFRIADGREVEYELGQALVRIQGQRLVRVVVFGEEGSEPLLGADTLQGFGLAVDPVGHRLIPVPGLLMVAERQ